MNVSEKLDDEKLDKTNYDALLDEANEVLDEVVTQEKAPEEVAEESVSGQHDESAEVATEDVAEESADGTTEEADGAADGMTEEDGDNEDSEQLEVTLLDADEDSVERTDGESVTTSDDTKAGFGVAFGGGDVHNGVDRHSKKKGILIAGIVAIVACLVAVCVIAYTSWIGRNTAASRTSSDDIIAVDDATLDGTDDVNEADSENNSIKETSETKAMYTPSGDLITNTNVASDSEYATEVILTYEKKNTTSNAKNLIILDAGHGGNDPGAIKNGSTEKEITLSMVNKVKSLLEGKGYTVYLTRTSDTFVDLEDRVAYENSYYCELFVSLHCNSYDSSSVSGLECFYTSDESGKYATSFVNALNGNGVIGIRKATYSEYRVTRKAENPAILVEMGYLTNDTDNNVLSNRQDELADVLANAIDKAVLENR